MAIFSDTQLASLGNLAKNLALKDTCQILGRDPSIETDSVGGKESDGYVVEATVSCALVNDAQKMPAHLLIAQQESGVVIQKMLLPRQTSINSSKLIRWNNITFKVIDTSEPTSYEVLRTVYVQRTTVG